MQDQVALGAKRSPIPVKGGIARATGSQKRGDADPALRTSGGAKWVLLKSTAGLDTQVASCSSSMSVPWVSLCGRLLTA